MPNAFVTRLLAAMTEKKSHCVVGLDPRPDLIPDAVRRAAGPNLIDQVVEFCSRIVDVVAPYAVAVKPQSAFFELCGWEGVRAYDRVVRHAQSRGLLVIGDVKRGDIGSTAAAYAEGHLTRRAGSLPEGFGADAVTVNPFLGLDGVKPFMEVAHKEGKGIFVLVKTSNPSSAEFQDLVSEGKPVYEHLAARVAEWAESIRDGAEWSPVGAVVGATWPETARRLRALMPHSILLLPGYGAQGGGARDVAPFFAGRTDGAVVNASRSIMYAWQESEGAWEDAVLSAVQQMRQEIEEAIQS